jgi:hypothetical protein
MTKAQQIEERIAEIRAEIRKFFESHPAPPHDHLRLTTHLAELQVALSERAELGTKSVVNLTRKLVWLTWALVAVSAALLIFTVYLNKDTHALIQREQTTTEHNPYNP